MDTLVPLVHSVSQNMKRQPITAYGGLKIENESITNSGEASAADHISSSKDYCWNPSSGTRFASGGERGKDLTWRPDYGIIIKEHTDNYLKDSLHREPPKSRRISHVQRGENKGTPLHSAIGSRDVATTLNSKRNKLSRDTVIQHQLSTYKPTNPHRRIKKAKRAQLEELPITQPFARNQVGIQVGESHNPGLDPEAENDPQNDSLLPNADLKDEAGIHDHHLKIKETTRRISQAFYKCKLLLLKIFFHQRQRVENLRISDARWETLLKRVDSKISLLKDVRERLLMAERCSKIIDGHTYSKEQLAVVLDSSSRILSEPTETCLKKNSLLWQIKVKGHAQGTLSNFYRIYILLKHNFLDIRHWAHIVRRQFYATRSQSITRPIVALHASIKANLRDILESLESMKSSQPHEFLHNGKPSVEEISSKFAIADKEEGLQRLEQIYLRLKENYESFHILYSQSWTNRLQQLWLLRNGSTEEVFLEWHLLPFSVMFRAFRTTRTMIYAYTHSATQRHNLHVLEKPRKAKRVRKLLILIQRVIHQIGLFDYHHIRPLYGIFLLAVRRSAQGKTVAMLQSRLEDLKVAKQKRLLISRRKVSVPRSTPSMSFISYRSAANSRDEIKTPKRVLSAKTSPVARKVMQSPSKKRVDLAHTSEVRAKRISHVQTSAGNTHNAESIIKEPPITENVGYVKISPTMKNISESVTKVPPTMKLNIRSNLQMRGMHISCTDQVGDGSAASSKELHRDSNSCHGALTNRAAQLEYQIPTTVLQSGMRASPQTPAAYWSYDLYRNSSNDRIKLHYCVTKKSIEAVCKYFLDQPVLGFDMEWDVKGRSGFKNKVSLIQLASEDRIALFHVSLFEDEDVSAESFPTLKAIMESENVIKAGVSIKGDCTRLRKNIGIDACGLIELSHLHNLVKYSSSQPEKVSKRAVALAIQVEEHLQLPLRKGSVRESDWTERLNAEQMIYAASDAYAGYRLYHVLEEKRLKLHPIPPKPAYADLGLPIKLAEKSDMNDYKTPNEGSGNGERPSPIDELTNRLPLMISNATETQENCLSSTYSSSDLESGSSLRISAQDAKHELPSRGKARFSEYPEIQEAEAWIKKWRAARSSSVALKMPAANLRVYTLWHTQSLEISRIARMLRDPPLQLSTVSCYILDCLKTEKLPFDESRVQDIIRLIPRFLVHGKYKHFLRRAQLTASEVK